MPKFNEPYLDHQAEQRKQDAEELRRLEAHWRRWGWLCKIIGHRRQPRISIESGVVPGKFDCPRCGQFDV